MPARTLMVQGTASSVGKSLLVTALCRILRERGLRVAPFKSQNMALNSFVTPDGGEIGRAQAVQAEAAGIEPAVEMNPILLKPEGHNRSQVVVLGKPRGSMTFGEYHELKPELCGIISRCLARLREDYDIVVIEGAGSPAEINLSSFDIVNMYVAEVADAPVILVGDIDRGGVFAQFVGTMELLAAPHRKRVAALLINKFRGDVALLKPGLDFLTGRFDIPVLGVVPYIDRLRIADEDSVALEGRRGRGAGSPGQIDIEVVRLPGISNYDDFLALEHEDGVVVRFIEGPEETMPAADLVVLPGSKNTVADLRWLCRVGIGDAIIERVGRGDPVLGICGGCQMLGESIEDPHGVESSERIATGLGLLPLWTRFDRSKLTARVRARVETPSLLTGGKPFADEIPAYEIHMGRVVWTRGAAAPFRILSRNGVSGQVLDGAISEDGAAVGTMLHGIFENGPLRAMLLAGLRERKGLEVGASRPIVPSVEHEYARLAAAVRENIDCALLELIAGIGQSKIETAPHR
jgi:adenosylcobyric acid synthase